MRKNKESKVLLFEEKVDKFLADLEGISMLGLDDKVLKETILATYQFVSEWKNPVFSEVLEIVKEHVAGDFPTDFELENEVRRIFLGQVYMNSQIKMSWESICQTHNSLFGEDCTIFYAVNMKKIDAIGRFRPEKEQLDMLYLVYYIDTL